MQALSIFKATSVAFFFGCLTRISLACLICCCLALSAAAQTWRVQVADVLDGDTLVLSTGERLRLRGIDSPEIRRRDKPGQYFGTESRKILTALVRGRDIYLDRQELGADRYGRLVGVARLGDGRLINLVMIEEGAAFVYPHSSDKDKDLAKRLVAAQVTAMRRGQGFWPKILSLPAARKGYVGTISTRRFHTLGCSTGQQVKKRNQIHFSSLGEAFEAGYAPARECTPWPMR